VRVVNPSRLQFGNSVVLQQDVLVECHLEGRLVVGDDVHVSRGGVIACGKGELFIGDHTIIGEYTSIRNSQHGTRRSQIIRAQDEDCRALRIGRDVWIGRGCAILPGVTIGDGAVVGANSVVTRDVEAFAVVAGAPARLLRYRE
jgi:acetyltransferase-like isoleucine patch superfamily enzyme